MSRVGIEPIRRWAQPANELTNGKRKDEGAIVAGSKVVVHSLESKTELNGAEGECEVWDASKQRWEVCSMGARGHAHAQVAIPSSFEGIVSAH